MAHLTITVALQLVTFSIFKECEISYKTLLILQLFKRRNFLIILENKNPRKEKIYAQWKKDKNLLESQVTRKIYNPVSDDMSWTRLAALDSGYPLSAYLVRVMPCTCL